MDNNDYSDDDSNDGDYLETSASHNVRLNNGALKKLAQKEEPRFLSILLKNKECLMDCMSYGIKPGEKGHFWDLEARFFYGLIHAYYQKYNTILTRTAIDSVMESIEKIGGVRIDDEHRAKTRMYWDKIYGMEAPIEDYELIKDNINNRFVQWQAYEMYKQELDLLVHATSNQAEIVKKTKEKFLKIENLESDKYTLTMDIKTGMEKASEYIAHRREFQEDTPSIMCGIDGIDSMYHGFAPGTYTIITGMINGGKTTLMFNIAFNMAKAGWNVVYLSLEKSAVLLYIRLLALHALVDYNRIKIGGKAEKGLSDFYYSKLLEAKKDLDVNIMPRFTCVQAAGGTKLSKLISEVDKVKSQQKIDVLVVDYLGVIGHETHHPSRPDLDEAMTSQRLQNYGRVNNFVTITAAQLKTPSTKEIRGKTKKATTADDASQVEINTEDLAGSKMIIADADNALAVILNADTPATKMFVYGTKARDDEAKKRAVLDFDGKLGRVCDRILEPGQIIEVDQLIYNSELSEETLKSDDGLFDKDEIEAPQNTSSKVNDKKEEVIDVSDELFDSILDEPKSASDLKKIKEKVVVKPAKPTQPTHKDNDELDFLDI